jgi:hypothetical protein
MQSETMAAVHETAPWHFAVTALLPGLIAWRFRRSGGGTGPFGRGPYDRSGGGE